VSTRATDFQRALQARRSTETRAYAREPPNHHVVSAVDLTGQQSTYSNEIQITVSQRSIFAKSFSETSKPVADQAPQEREMMTTCRHSRTAFRQEISHPTSELEDSKEFGAIFLGHKIGNWCARPHIGLSTVRTSQICPI
jgi:hypothetical protein